MAATGGPDKLVISIGTWSLVGVELSAPLISDAGREANFANEAGVLGTIRFLRNAVGLWLIQECLREWRHKGDASLGWEGMIERAGASPAFASLFDPDGRVFMEPDRWPAGSSMPVTLPLMAATAPSCAASSRVSP